LKKLCELHRVLYVGNYDITFITETWLHGKVPKGLLDPAAKYTIVRKDHLSHKGGGDCAFISKQYDQGNAV